MTFLNRDDSIVAKALGATGRGFAFAVLSLGGIAAWCGSPPASAGGQCGQQVTRLTAYGFEHNAVDDALLEIDCITGKLKISNLGSSGCDGYSISLGDSDGYEVELEEILAPASTQDGAITTITRNVGPAASTIMISEDIGNQVEVRTSFPGFNVTSKTLRVYEITSSGEIILKEEVTGHTGNWDFRLDDPMDPMPRLTGYGGSGGLCRPRLRCGGGGSSGGLCRPIFVNGGGGIVDGNLIEVIAENFTPAQGSSTLTLQAGAGISEMIVTDTALLQFPELPHRVIDNAIFEPPTSNTRLKISNLGSSGCDGVSIDLGESDTFEMNVQEINDGNGLPTGGYTETQVYGTVAGVPDQLITTSRITDTGTELELSVTGAATYAVKVLEAGLEVFSGGHPTGTPSGRVSDSNPCKSEQHFVLPNLDGLGFPFLGTDNYLTVWRWDSPTMIEVPGGITIQGDELHVFPEGAAAPDTLTRFELRGADVNSIEIGGETSFHCRGGNVNSGPDGVAENVLWVNGSTGATGTREVCVEVRERIEVALTAAPQGPTQAKYFLCAWIGGPQSPTNLTVQSSVVGCFVNPIPLTGGGPLPFRCLRGGLPNAVCRQVRELPAPPTAPFSATKAGGLANPLTLTLQAFLEDNGASHPIGYSVTNAVIVKIQ